MREEELAMAAVFLVIGAAIVGVVGAGIAMITDQGTGSTGIDATTTADPPTTTTTSSEQTARSPPTAVNQSLPVARSLAANASQNYSNVSVYINNGGTIVLTYATTAENGPSLKDEIVDIATMYAVAVEGHADAGGLTIYTAGIRALVSKHTAAAYARGDIKRSALKKTIVYQSVNRTEAT